VLNAIATSTLSQFIECAIRRFPYIFTGYDLVAVAVAAEHLMSAQVHRFKKVVPLLRRYWRGTVSRKSGSGCKIQPCITETLWKAGLYVNRA